MSSTHYFTSLHIVLPTHDPVRVMLMQTVNTVMSGAEDNISQRVLSPPAVKSPPHKKINVHNMISHETMPLTNVHEQHKATKKPLTAAIHEYIFTLNSKNVHTWILYCMWSCSYVKVYSEIWVSLYILTWFMMKMNLSQHSFKVNVCL